MSNQRPDIVMEEVTDVEELTKARQQRECSVKRVTMIRGKLACHLAVV